MSAPDVRSLVDRLIEDADRVGEECWHGGPVSRDCCWARDVEATMREAADALTCAAGERWAGFSVIVDKRVPNDGVYVMRPDLLNDPGEQTT